MKRLLALLLLILVNRALADSQTAHIYGDESRGFSIDDDNYSISINYSAAPNTPDGTYNVSLRYDGGAITPYDTITVTNGVCSPSSRIFYPDPAGGHAGRVLYIGAGNHTWRALGPDVVSSELPVCR